MNSGGETKLSSLSSGDGLKVSPMKLSSMGDAKFSSGATNFSSEGGICCEDLGIGGRLCGVFLLFLLYRICSVKQSGLDLLGHQAIGAYLAILKGMRLAEADVQHSCNGSIEINGKDEK